jgi:autotransporter-associated beta strand protein
MFDVERFQRILPSRFNTQDIEEVDVSRSFRYRVTNLVQRRAMKTTTAMPFLRAIGRFSLCPSACSSVLAATVLLLSKSSVTFAGSTTWDLNPISRDWNTAANWTPSIVPNASGDTATFGLSNTPNISVSANTIVSAIAFSAGASAFTITVNPFLSGQPNDNSLTLNGAGIINISGVTQNFVSAVGGANYNYANLIFMNSASAGSATRFTNVGAAAPFTAGGVSGYTRFYDTSTAGNGIFINNGATSLAGSGGFTDFFGSSTAANGTFNNEGGTFTAFGYGAGGGAVRFFQNSTAANANVTNNPATVSGSSGGYTQFYQMSTAGNGIFTNNGASVGGAASGFTAFYDRSSAGNSTLVANGELEQAGGIFFQDASIGGTSRIVLLGNGYLNISRHDRLGVTVGSIEGDGNIFLGKRTLTVGTNNLDTTFAGAIQQGSLNQSSLTKIGLGSLNLTGVNTYTGNTRVSGGVLRVDGSIMSNAFVNQSGTLSGTGMISGNVINRSEVKPGGAVMGRLTINGNYTQGTDADLLIDIAGANPDQISLLDVFGSVKLSGLLNPVLQNGFIPAVGESFTFLDYLSSSGSLFIFNPNIDDAMEHWVVTYEPGHAILTVAAGNVSVPDPTATVVLLTLGLLGLVTSRYFLLRKQA